MMVQAIQHGCYVCSNDVVPETVVEMMVCCVMNEVVAVHPRLIVIKIVYINWLLGTHEHFTLYN
jgi:hypothetical protein